jgi:hypothetical protein
VIVAVVLSQAASHFQYFEAGQQAVPEPASFTMLRMGAVGMMEYVWRRKWQKVV